MNRILALVIGVALAACHAALAQTTPIRLPLGEMIGPKLAPPVVGDYTKIRTLTVVSALGSEFKIVNIHPEGPVSRTLNVTDWQFDRQTSQIVRHFMAGRFTLREPAVATLQHFDTGQFARDAECPKPAACASVYRKHLAPLNGEGNDAFIVVRPQPNGGAFLQYEPPAVPTINTAYIVEIVDARSYAVIGSATSRIQATPASQPAAAFVLTDMSYAVTDHSNPSGLQVSRYREITNFVLRSSLLETLRALQLGLALPPAGDHSRAALPHSMFYLGINSVAVLSGIGDELSVLEHDNDTHQTQTFTLPIRQWNIDADVERRVRAALQPRYAIKDIAGDHAAMAGISIVDDSGKPRLRVEGLPDCGGCDAYVIVVKNPVRLWESLSHGLLLDRTKPDSIWSAHTADVSAYFTVAVVDAQTRTVLSSRVARLSRDGKVGFPINHVDKTLWPEAGALTNKQSPALRDAMLGAIGESLDYTLGQLELK